MSHIAKLNTQLNHIPKSRFPMLETALAQSLLDKLKVITPVDLIRSEE